MNGEYTQIVSGKAPNSESATQGRDPRVNTFKHAVCRDSVLLLAGCFLLDVRNARSKVVLVDGIALTLAVLDLVLQLLALVVQPLRDLLATEGELARTVCQIEDGQRVLRVHLTSDGQGSTARRGDGTTSLVTVAILEGDE